MTKKKETVALAAGELLAPYQKRFDEAVKKEIAREKKHQDLLQACSYSVLSNGKRLRPALVWMVADALDADESVSLAALAVEFFHASSLVVDDLPCMDDDDFRRGKPSTHRAFSEQAAILASFALTAWGFDAITRVVPPERAAHRVLQAAVAAASGSVGLPGLIGGQWLDIKEGRPTRERFIEIVDRKTGDLFGLCFILGWLFGGGDIARLPQLRQMAGHFGRAFQLVDDLDDLQQDRAAGKEANSAILFGEEETLRLVVEHVERFCCLASAEGLDETPLIPLAQTLSLVGV